jgi:hypothetical protein
MTRRRRHVRRPIDDSCKNRDTVPLVLRVPEEDTPTGAEGELMGVVAEVFR